MPYRFSGEDCHGGHDPRPSTGASAAACLRRAEDTVIPRSRGGRDAPRYVLDGGSTDVTPPSGESNRAASDAAPLLGRVLPVRACPDASWWQRAAVPLGLSVGAGSVGCALCRRQPTS